MMLLRSTLAALLVLPAACGTSPEDGGDEESADAARSWIDEHRYELPAAEVWTAAQIVVSEDGATVKQRRPTSDGGEIVARRPEGHRVQLSVHAVDREATRVTLAVSPPNGTLAALIQGKIGERLGLRKAQADLFGETSVETVYPRALEDCVAASERTCRTLDLELVRRMTQDDQVRIEARDRDAHTIRFSFRRIGDGDAETAVMFTAEAAREATLEELRRAFERHLFPGRE